MPARLIRVALYARERREVGGDILRELRARDAEAARGLLREDIRAVAALEDGDDTAGAADGGDVEQLAGGPLKILRRQIQAIRV